MKTFKFFKSIVPAVALSLFIFTSCDKDDNDTNVSTYKISGDASGAQIVPSTINTGAGTISGTYDARTNALIYNITWTNLSGDVFNADIHGPAATGANGGVLQSFNITANGTAGAATGTLTLTDAQEKALLEGNTYYILKTATNSDGEIRGQIKTTVN